MCTYRRPERLLTTLDQLSSQISCKIKIYIWNNKIDHEKQIEKAIARFPELDITLYNSRENIGGFARFRVARELSLTYPAVIFIDDDVELSPKSLSTLIREFKPETIHSFFTFRFTSKSSFFERFVPQPGEEADYCGTGGMICDTSIFRQAGLFKCPDKYLFVEDVWLSYYAMHILDWKLYRSFTDIKIIDDDRNQYPGLRQTKQEFFQYLLAQGWGIPRSNDASTFGE
jgi:GT2 family glycosyltransferase